MPDEIPQEDLEQMSDDYRFVLGIIEDCVTAEDTLEAIEEHGPVVVANSMAATFYQTMVVEVLENPTVKAMSEMSKIIGGPELERDHLESEIKKAYLCMGVMMVRLAQRGG